MPESFDEAFPGGMDECISTLGQEPSIDDPEALCGWLKENGFEALRQTGADTILAGLEVEFVSVVDEPAQDSEWLLAKSATADEDEWTPGENRLRTADIVLRKQDPEDSDDDEEDEGDDEEDEDEEMKVWAAVLKPGEADAHGDIVPEPEIESAAHRYLKEYRKMDADHDLLDGEGVPIESYIVRGDPDVFETPDGTEREYPPGTWIMGAELSPEAWKRVESGELSGFSIYGGAAKLNAAALLTEEQKAALSAAVGKRVDLDDLADAVQAFEEATGEDVEDTTLVEFVEWVEANPDYDMEDEDENGENDDDGEESDEDDEEEASKGVSPEVVAQAEETLAVVKSMGNDDGNTDDDGEQNDISETLSEIRDTVKSTDEAVQKHGDRLDGLRDDLSEVRDDLDETRKEVGLVEPDEGDEGDASGAEGGDGGDGDGDGQAGETSKAFEELTEEIRGLREDLTKDEGDGDGDGDVDRKTQKNAGVGDDSGGDEGDEGNVEKSAGDLNVSFGGIASEGDD